LRPSCAMAVKIMMPPDVVANVAESLSARKAIGDIAKSSVTTEPDRHYLTVVLHKGVSPKVPSTRLSDIAKLLSCSTGDVNRYMAEHMVSSGPEASCTVCARASKALKAKVRAEQKRKLGMATRAPETTLTTLELD
jgi:hypothetical protein